MSKAQWTDFLRAIIKSKGRYISLIFIVALGTAFFTGVRSAEPDMMASADKYYDESGLMDVRILGTMGLTDADLTAISDTEGILQAEGGHSTEVFAQLESGHLVVNVMSHLENLNQMTIKEGRMPETPEECFLDASIMTAGGYEIGDTIVLSNEEGEAPDDLTHDSFTIVGYGTWSWYLSWTRGAASIGDGSLDGFMVVSDEAFDMDYYTVIYATVQDVAHLDSFSEAYEDAVDLVTSRIEEIAGDRCSIRYNEVYDDASKVIEDAKQQIADGEKELQDAHQKLEDAEAEYADGMKDYEDGKNAYQNGWVAYNQGKEQLEQAKKDLESGKAEYNKGLAAYNEGKQTLEKSKKEFNEKKKEYDKKAAQLSAAEAEYAAAKAEVDAAQAKIDAAEKELNAAEAQYEAGLVEYAEKEAQLADAKTQLDAGWAELQRGEMELQMLKSMLDMMGTGDAAENEQYQQMKAQYDAGVAEAAAGRATLEQKQAEYDAAVVQMEAAKAELDAAPAKIEAGRAELNAAKEEIAPYKAKLAESRAELDKAQAQLKEGGDALAAAQKQIESGEKTLQETKQQLDDANATIQKGEQDYKDGVQKLENSLDRLYNTKDKLAQAEKDLEDARQELDDSWEQYADEAANAEQRLEEARQEVADGEEELAKLEEGKWYVLGRDSIQTSVEYGMDAERIGAIGDVLPVIFFLVAALVSLTTMTRMVEEERTLIGTMKALGYSKFSIAAKYILYAFSATLIGGLMGVIIGSKFLPYVIMIAYSMLYSNVQYTLLPLHWELCFIAIGLAMLCTVGAALMACYKEMLSTPAALMRPPAPKQGKRVLLERIPGIWNRLNFSMKATIRNLVRYKKRFFMTVFGIGGCMAILLACFGLRDSISVIGKKQYTDVWTYSAFCSIDDKQPLEEQRAFLDTAMQEQSDILGGLLSRVVTVDVSSDQLDKSVYLYAVDDPSIVQTYMNMHDRETKKPLTLTDEGVILSEKLGNMLGVSAGESFNIHIDSTTQKSVKVLGLTENYTSHFIYMTVPLYETLFGETPAYNQLYLEFSEDLKYDAQLEIAAYLMGSDAVTSVTLVKDQMESLNDMVGALNMVVWVLIVAAGLLAFVVLFNLNNINISERRRELATLKVLGFYDNEVAMYVYRENIILTIFGIVAGLFLGAWLHQYLVSTLEVDLIMFGREISWFSYLLSIVLTAVFALLVNISMYYKLQQIDMIESLKSVE